MSWSDYINLPQEEQETLYLRVYERHRDWIERTLSELKAEWMLVLGGKVVR